MGGNSRAVDRSTGEVKMFAGKLVYASPVEFKKIDADKFRGDILYLLLELNVRSSLRKDMRPIWGDDKGDVWSNVFDTILGSSCHFFDMPTADFIKHKATLGDIDVAVPEQNIENLWALLESLENEEIVPGIIYLGQNRKKLRKPSINTVFCWNGLFVQIDFVGLPFHGAKPDPFVRFSHSSAWEDMKVGLKGVAHKYLLQTLTWAVSHEENIVVLTDKSPLFPESEMRLKVMHEPPRMMSFSVDRGLRARLVQQFDINGKPYRHDGMKVYKELPTSVSDYVTEPESIFMVLFGKRPDEMDMAEFQSFQGLLRLCKRYQPPHIAYLAIDQMIRFKLYGPGQAMSRDSAAQDRQIKERIIEVAKIWYPSFSDVDYPVKTLQKKYYATYRERAFDE